MKHNIVDIIMFHGNCRKYLSYFSIFTFNFFSLKNKTSPSSAGSVLAAIYISAKCHFTSLVDFCFKFMVLLFVLRSVCYCLISLNGVRRPQKENLYLFNYQNQLQSGNNYRSIQNKTRNEIYGRVRFIVSIQPKKKKTTNSIQINFK